MPAAFLLSLREGLEAALIIGIVLGAVRKFGKPELKSAVWRGAASAALVSLAVGYLLTKLGLTMEGPAEQTFEGIAMVMAAGLLTWMIFWMSKQARHIKAGLEAEVRRALMRAGTGALFSLAFMAVVREGIELAIFLTAATLASGVPASLAGALLGLGVAGALGWAMFASTVRLDLRRFFQVTGALLLVFAAGLVGHAVHEFNELGWIPSLIEHVYDLSAILNESSPAGMALRTLAGYNANPALTEVIAYAGYVAAVLLNLRRSGRTAVEASATAAA